MPAGTNGAACERDHLAGAPRQGYGTLLVLHVIEWARSIEADRVDLSATPDGQRIYERAGFKRTTAPRMKLILQPHDGWSETVYVATDEQEDLQTAWEVVQRHFNDHDAPSTLLGVSVLGYRDQLVEVEAVAAGPESVVPRLQPS
jgi:Acetyltransferase (GNAT) family